VQYSELYQLVLFSCLVLCTYKSAANHHFKNTKKAEKSNSADYIIYRTCSVDSVAILKPVFYDNN
jgi:hypothetical protein